MTHKDEGHYSDKHSGEKIDKACADKLAQVSAKEEITCAAAHKAAQSLGVTPEQIGVQIDLLELRITECQLGLFGYAGTKKKLDPDIQIEKDLDRELDGRVIHKRISCSDCWDIAAAHKVKRLDIGSACEKKKVRVKPCQLGTF